MAPPRGRLLAAVHEPFQGELADRLEHGEAWFDAVRRDPLHQALVDQGRDRVQCRRSLTRAHRLRGHQAEPAGEDRQPPEEGLLGGGQQVVAPGDPGAHGPQPFRDVLRAVGEQGEAAAEPGQQRLRRQHGHPGGRQLDRQRQAVQAPADLHHRGRVLVGQHDGRAHRRGSLDEEPDGLVLDQRRCRHRPGGIRERQRRDGQDVLTGDPQQRAARDQQRDARAADHQIDQNRPGGEDVLEVVEDQEQAPRAEGAHQRVGGGPPGGLHDAERLGDPGRDPLVVANRRELDEGDLVEAGIEVLRDRNGEPGLPDAAGSGERDEPGRPIQQERTQALCLVLPPDEPGEIRRWAADPDGRLTAGSSRPARIPPATVGTTSIGHRLEPSVCQEVAEL